MIGARYLLRAAVLAGVALAGAGGAQAAERIVLSVSQPEVRITSSFSGASLALFGVAEGEQTPDVVVTVRGPKEDFVAWRKSRVFGLWINTDSRHFVEVPAFLSVQSSRPLAGMASPETLRVEQVGLARNILLQRIGPDYADVVAGDPFRVAFLRLRQAEGLYGENESGVRFLAPHVFRADFSIPGTAPIGPYDVRVKLFRGGQFVGEAATEFYVMKTGFEQTIANFAQNAGVLYGLAVAAGSLLIGFCANILFRKE